MGKRKDYQAEVDPIVKHGTVSRCQRVNVRSEPRATAPVLCTIGCGTVVEIDETESTKGFYRVTFGDGMRGFCMKQFIHIS